MSFAYVGFGANLGQPSKLYGVVAEELRRQPGVLNVTASRLFQTVPVGKSKGTGTYRNGCFKVETTLDVRVLFSMLGSLETAHGRVRRQRWDARELDLDLLFFDEQTVDSATLVLPHPRMHFRRFVLAPLAEFDERLVHPLLGISVGDLLQLLDSPNATLLLVGGPGDLAEWAGERFRARYPERRVDYCPSHSVCLKTQVAGNRVIGAAPFECPGLDAEVAPGNGWLVLMDTPRHNVPAATGAVEWLPVVDCRGADRKMIVAELEYYFDSMLPLMESDDFPLHNE